jgi:hypothetical protein
MFIFLTKKQISHDSCFFAYRIGCPVNNIVIMNNETSFLWHFLNASYAETGRCFRLIGRIS